MVIYPAIDLLQGRCVRLRQGDFDSSTIYSSDPADVAQQLASAGFEHLHVVDLDGARSGECGNRSAIQQILATPLLRVQVGGGVRTTGYVEELLALGARRVVVGSIAVRRPELIEEWIRQFGSESILVAIDSHADHVAVSGWEESSERTTGEVALAMASIGVEAVMCTDIARDGMLEGTNLDLYRRVRTVLPAIELIASGGVTTVEDLDALLDIGVDGAIVGKALYERRFEPEQLRAWEIGSRAAAIGRGN